ncbi:MULTISPECIES: alpha/beta hydrolase [Planktothrix]|nr:MULTISPECIES: alpha/beta hydrolase [Planktothrix]
MISLLPITLLLSEVEVLPITHYPLPITHYPLPITHSLFPILNSDRKF